MAKAVVANSVGKVYAIGEAKIEVLKDVSLAVGKGEFVAVSGVSGSGKTTLLNIIGGLDKPTDGTIFVFGEDLGRRNEDFLAVFRCNTIGFVFQSYNLISTLTVSENIAFPMEWLKRPTDEIDRRVTQLVDKVDLKQRAEHFPSQLSGGEQQRVAFARALANDPPLLLVDEPTGNLDLKTSLKLIEVLQDLKADGKTVIAASHDRLILELADKTAQLEEGRLVGEDD